MCGRFTNQMTWREIHDLYEITNKDFRPNLRPNSNIAPTQTVPVIRLGANGRELVLMRWGFEEHWARSSIINATEDKVTTSRLFKKSFEERRCLVPSDGFYEWKKGEDGKRLPFRICMSDESPFAFAGIWRTWTADKDGKDHTKGDEVETFTIVTTTANDLLKTIHNRMPVILDRGDYDDWLDASSGSELLKPYSADKMKTYTVSTRVNSVRNNDPECVAAIS